MANKSIPGGLKATSIMFYISAGVNFIAALIFILGGSLAGAYANQLAASIGVASSIIIGALVVFGFLFAGLGVLDIFVGMGLWKCRSWARITAIVLASVSLAFALLSLFGGNILGGLISLGYNGFIVGYLAFSKEAKSAFR